MTSELVKEITLFVLAGYVGLELIRKVPRILHTPLMSGANAISGVTLIGAIVVASAGLGRVATGLGFVAVVAATLNVVGGFLVTDRMLRMFRRKRGPDEAAGASAQPAPTDEAGEQQQGRAGLGEQAKGKQRGRAS